MHLNMRQLLITVLRSSAIVYVTLLRECHKTDLTSPSLAVSNQIKAFSYSLFTPVSVF